MEAGDPRVVGVAGDGEGQASAGGPGGQGGLGGPGRGGSGEAGAVPREAPQAAPALDAAVGGSDGEPAPAARAPRREPIQFTLAVLLRSTMEAEIAYYFLTPGAHTLPEAAHLDVRVSGSLLAIRLTAENMNQLRTSITSLLQELLLVIQTMRHILPASVFVNSNRANRG